MESGKCGGYGKREGNCGVALSQGNRTGLCSKCYANKNYHDLHPKAAVKKARKPPALAPPIELPALVAEPKTGEEVMRLHGFEAPVVVTLRLSQRQIDKLLAVLLA